MSEPYGLFERFGVELEYMIVSREDLRVLPVCDRVLHAVCGEYASDVDLGPLSWSNELVLHVIEFKTNGPAETLEGLDASFQEHVQRADELLVPLGGCLMPTAMHPWMNPDAETRLWPHEYNAVYEAFDRVFNCRGHGWANLQSSHLNLPFANDDEFGRLHAAIRLVLPILPALAASSPAADGQLTGLLDTRLEHYRKNSRRLPLVAGHIIPEPIFTMEGYQKELLGRIYAQMAPHDPQGTLQHEWLNARGAIARFERNTFEIRLLDVQECPAADLAVLALVVAVLQALVREEWISYDKQKTWHVEPLEEIFLEAIRRGEEAHIPFSSYLRVFGSELAAPCRAGDLWRHLYDVAMPAAWKEQFGAPLRLILEQGTLARRMTRAVEQRGGPGCLPALYRDLCTCLAEGRCFDVQDDRATAHLRAWRPSRAASL